MKLFYFYNKIKIYIIKTIYSYGLETFESGTISSFKIC